MTLDAFIAHRSLPIHYRDDAQRYFNPIVETLRSRLTDAGGPKVLGINGAQGTGKSTLADLIAAGLGEQGFRVVVLSIDDLYLTRAERQDLADSVHPLLAVRGVPGTHDVRLGCKVLETLMTLEAGQQAKVPRFNKAVDDRRSLSEWSVIDGPVDLVIFEGWCVGSIAGDDDSLARHSNALEADADPDLVWRRFVNLQLSTAYPALFERIDWLVFLKAPDFESVAHWRIEQEHKLRAGEGKGGHAVMSDGEVRRFIQHYERITRRNIEVLPDIADVVIALGPDHRVTAVSERW